MNRRQLGAGLLGGAAATLGACAMTDPMYQGAGRRGPALGGMGHHGMGMEMGPAEREHVVQTALTGQVALRSSQVALQRTQNPAVRQFAQFEIEEQTGVAAVLQEASGMAPPPLDPRRLAMLAALERVPAGPGFDRAYVDAQRMGHEELRRIQEDYLRSGRNMHNRHIAMLARGRIVEHLTDLSNIARSM